MFDRLPGGLGGRLCGERGGVHREKLRADIGVEQQRAGEHGKRDAEAGDHARADEQHAGLEARVDELLALEGEEAVLGVLALELDVDEVGLEPREHLAEGADLLGGVAVGVQDADDRAAGKTDDQRVRLIDGFLARAVERLERFRGGDARRERELLVVDHLPLHGDGEEHAHRAGQEGERGDQPDGLDVESLDESGVAGLQQQERAEHGGDGGTGGVASRGGGGLHAVVFQQRHLGLAEEQQHAKAQDEHRENHGGDIAERGGERGIADEDVYEAAEYGQALPPNNRDAADGDDGTEQTTDDVPRDPRDA